MALITISVASTIIDTMVDSDNTISDAIQAGANITTCYGVSVVPISNTKSRVFVAYL
jgi:hypothetical protein